MGLALMEARHALHIFTFVSVCFDCCKFHKKSAAFAFMDIITTFAVLLRPIIFYESDTVIQLKLSDVKLKYPQIQMFYYDIILIYVCNVVPDKSAMTVIFGT